MKENKTCGECRYHKNNRCMLPCHTINHPAENSACHRFEAKTPLTKGDVIRQMSNEELAKFFGCLRHLEMCPHAHSEYPCEKCNLDYLNAPAESEVEDE